MFSAGGGEVIGWRRRWGKWRQQAYFEPKRAKGVPEGREIHRTGERTEKGTFVAWAQEYVETPGLSAFMSARWPKYVGDYPLDEEISRRTIAEGLCDILLHIETQVGLPLLYFQLRVAMNSVVFKLSAKGSRHATNRLTMLGSDRVIRLCLCRILRLYAPGFFLS